jgi:hypothetical protein
MPQRGQTSARDPELQICETQPQPHKRCSGLRSRWVFHCTLYKGSLSDHTFYLNLDVLCVITSLDTTLKDLHSLGSKAAADGASSALASCHRHSKGIMDPTSNCKESKAISEELGLL